MAAENDGDGGLRIKTLSTRPDMVTGGDVLVSINGTAAGGVQVLLNNHDITAAFQVQADGSLLGIVSGLSYGANHLVARRVGKHGDDDDGSGSIVLTNYPITGPVFSGPHETPYFCMTDQFALPGTTTTLGAPLDSDCSAATRVNYVYRNSTGSYKALPAGNAYPADMVDTTTSLGQTVHYIVRVETGTINRAIYQTAILHDPLKDPVPTPFSPPPSWNHRLVYTLGGGCVGGWYIQGKSVGNNNILEDLLLRQGYGVASSSLNVFGNNCQELLAAESLMMVRERFIENFGAPQFTIGYGCSGGSEQAQPIADDYPGLLDGILVGCSFPELTAAIVLDLTDGDLFTHYMQGTTIAWTADQQDAATGYPTPTTPATLASLAVRIKAQGGSCNAIIPVSMQFDQVTNPKGVRCDIYDHLVNVFGRDPATGYARRALDNVGVQYGLGAVNAGTISVDQFLDLNAKIGGYDNNGNFVSTRTLGDRQAIEAAYRTGRVTNAGKGLRHTPIIDYRGYVDQPENGNENHARFHSFSLRARLLRENGNYNNQVMLIEDGRAGTTGLFGDTSPVLSHALTQMDQWLTALKADTSGKPISQRIQAAKPADLVDACFTNHGTVKIAEEQVFTGNTACNQLYPAFSTPRMVAGEPLENDVLKCELKRVSISDYKVKFTPAQEAQLRSIFPQGVCDYSRPGVEQESSKVWASF
jgi:hypothetical protein